ncbi:L-serine ammonia-lyase, iron-sulfur-dependent, subunit alpha [Caloramator sp. CAR-1]|uniref:L-serine ammonia-lyase, iron-sulfur-dependent, subunit alpha n=1 Tax=Caloramator sp. CAR-1 TaxID=3062777 RepID=UPI0026E2E2E6|nr:L-serine ammonia-lyase, iron-sulfur-dependent, subunit alpha [Caloramator sp. CAR-1]MDO6353537.1 L-serine ammonia-lyase, iron-sulfur-dependent, subunit alpha [Caloramator sp. CAR-1]
MYTKGKDLLNLTKESNKKIWEIVLDFECERTGKTKEEVFEGMRNVLKVMMDSANKGLNEEVNSISGLIGGNAKKVEDYRRGKTISGDIINKAMARALSVSEVNASMGRIVAAPTAGSAGILPAVMITAAEVLEKNEDEMVKALFTASGIGQIIAKNATVSGAEGGCQAECGSAAAMAAAAVVEMAGGTPEQAIHAASIAIQNILGLVCDPVAGLVEAPCYLRNSSGAVNALTSADLALAGVKSIIPFDEVVDAMYKVGKSLPFELRETALGGIASTPTGQKLMKNIFGE